MRTFLSVSMRKKQVLTSGATLVFASDTKSLVSSDPMAEDRYTIEVNGEVLFKSLSQDEYFDRMEDLALEYYQRGVPRPESIKTIIINENGELKNGSSL